MRLWEDFLADPVDPADITKGVILRGFVDVHHDSLSRVSGSGFSTAWSIRQSGPAGPLTWQLNTPKVVPNGTTEGYWDGA